MAIEYTVTVKRNSDNKVLGKFFANELKIILGSEFEKLIHCEHQTNVTGVKFTCADLEAVCDAAFTKITSIYDRILEKKLMIPLCQNAEIKHEIEEDLYYLKEDLSELRYIMTNAAELQGAVECLVENQLKETTPAYQYNGDDLPKQKKKYADGEEYEDDQYIWTRDVYCEIEAIY